MSTVIPLPCSSSLHRAVTLRQWSVRVTSQGVRENILRSRLNLETALILTLKKIHPVVEVLACQKPVQPSH
jgi:hypothetical protein